MRSASPVRRLAIAAGLLIAVLVACGREITGPVATPVNVFKRVAAFAFTPTYETAIPAHALPAALTQVAFERVRITLRREDGTIALDTVVLFPVGADELTLTLNIPLAASAPASGVPLSLNLGYVNAAGDTVFKGGPIPVHVVPTVSGSPAPAAVQVPVHYTGPGASASSVVITPRSFAGNVGASAIFSAQALSSTGQVVAGTPIVFTSSNAGVVSINATSGAATLVARGTAKVYAQLLTGPADSATVTVTLPASQLQLVSGGGQTGSAGSTLATRVAARVLAADGIAVSGVTVSFAASGGGTVTPATAVSDASGNVSTQWKLGPTAGAQTLTVTSAGLTGSPITVNATALAVTPTRLSVVTQPTGAKAGSAIGAVSVAAQDAAGNTVASFVGDVSVAIGTNPGGAALSGTTTVKAVAGVATFSDLKLNRPGAGYTLGFSSADLTGASSAAFTITTGDATTLVFGPVPASVDAGLAFAPPVTVMAQDAAGNLVPTFTGSVTVGLGSNPTGAALGGTLTQAAVAGVASFGNLSITKRGSPYTLTASASGLTSATSGGFTITRGLPTGMSVVRGNAQSAAAGTLLSPITVRLHDAFSNGVDGVSIAFAVTGGGGSLSSATATTDADGNATVSWTIGAGAQTMTATYGTLPPLTLTATATGANLVWTGATNTDWSTASNWSPAFAPTASDAITIPVTTNAPTIGAPASVVSIVVATGATLTNNSTLTVSGSLNAGTTIVGTGSVMLAGSGTLRGVINQTLMQIAGTYTLAGATQITGPLVINGTGKLTVGGQSLMVTGNFATSGSGRLAMNNSADVVTITADVGFAGGSEAGFLTAGVLSVGGNFSATGSTFGATGSHTLKLASAVAPQALAFTSPLTGKGINHLVFEGAGAKTLSGAPSIMGDVSLLATSAPVEGEVEVKIGGNFTDATVFPDSGGNPNPMGGWRVSLTNFFGSGKTINSMFITSNVTVSGTVALAPCTSCLGADRFPYVLASDGYVQINGDVTASGAGAVLKLNGNHLQVSGNFATASGGIVELKDANDYLQVYGSATFGGGSTAARITAGVIEVIQDFTQNGAADSFAPSLGVYTYIGDPYLYDSGLRASRALRSRAAVAPSASSPAVAAARSRRMQQVTVIRAERAERLAKLDRRAAAYARRGMAAPPRGQAVGQVRASEGGVRLLRPRRVYSGTSNISFANPTSSFFAELYLSGPEFVLASDVQVKGELETGYSYTFTVYSNSATPRKLTSHGADVGYLTFNNVSWNLLDGSNIYSMDYVTFENMVPTVDQFTIARTSDELALCECSDYELYNWTFSTTPTTGKYIRATDTNGGPNVTTVYMTSPDPSAHGGKVATGGGAVIANWPVTSAVTWLGTTSTDWNNGLNWSGGAVPTSLDDVLIPSAAASDPVLTATASVHNLTIESGKTISMDCRLFNVYGNVVAPLGAPSVLDCDGDYMMLLGDGGAFNTVVGHFSTVKVLGNYKVEGPGSQLLVGYELRVDGTGNLTVNGGRVDAGNLVTYSDAAFTMTNAADQVFVGGTASFNGVSSALTAGTLTITDGSLSASADYFAPSGTHTVVFAGTIGYVSFTNPAQSFLQNAKINGGATMFLSSDALVNGTLSRGTGAGLAQVATSVYPSPARALVVNGLNQSGADAMQFNNVTLNLTGTSAVTFSNAAFVGFGPGFMGDALFEVNRSGGPFYFTGLDFSMAGFAADTTRHFVKNSGSADVRLIIPVPSSGLSNKEYIATGSGGVVWPYLP